MGLVETLAGYVVGAGVVLVLAQALLNSRRITRNGKPLRTPPNTLPLGIGHGLLFMQARHKLFSYFAKCERLHGYETLALIVPTLPPGVLISDPQNVDFVFRNDGVFTKGDFVKGRAWDLFGNGIINADGEFWKVQRKAGLNFLNTANLKVLTEVALPQNLVKVTDYVRNRAGTVIDLQHVFHEITTMLMGKMAYNMEDMRADDDFSQAFDYASGKTAERFQNPLWSITEIFFGGRFRKAVANVRAFGAKIVASAVKDRGEEKFAEADNKLNETSGSLIQSLLDAIGDKDMVADAALTYLSAGRDTTGQALTWCFYMLMRHRYIVAQIRKEVAEVLKRTDDDKDDTTPVSSALGDLDPTLFTPVSMPYTMAVFYETLRLFPPIPIEIRQNISPVTLPDGTFLPNRSVLVWCLWAMGRSRTTWGEDSDEFRPERWLVPADDNSDNNDEHAGSEGVKPKWKLMSRSPSEFPVFNGGPRTCLGKKMAEVVAVQTIATMLWLFEFVPVDEKDRVSKTSMTLPMEGGLPVVAKVRSRG